MSEAITASLYVVACIFMAAMAMLCALHLAHEYVLPLLFRMITVHEKHIEYDWSFLLCFSIVTVFILVSLFYVWRQCKTEWKLNHYKYTQWVFIISLLLVSLIFIISSACLLSIIIWLLIFAPIEYILKNTQAVIYISTLLTGAVLYYFYSKKEKRKLVKQCLFIAGFSLITLITIGRASIPILFPYSFHIKNKTGQVIHINEAQLTPGINIAYLQNVTLRENQSVSISDHSGIANNIRIDYRYTAKQESAINALCTFNRDQICEVHIYPSTNILSCFCYEY